MAPATTPDVAVVMVPLPAQGHLNQLLQLSRVLSARGLAVHYVGSTIHNRQVRDRATSLADVGGVEFHDVLLPPFASPSPNPNAKNAFPDHVQPALDAALDLGPLLANVVRDLADSYRRVVVIHDSLMSFPASAATSLPNVESFCFYAVSAISTFFYLWWVSSRPPSPAIDELGLLDIPVESTATENFLNFVNKHTPWMNTDSSRRLLNTCRAIEGRFIDLVAEDQNSQQKTFAVGPLNPITADQLGSGGGRERHECLKWLDEQPLASVVYVSFGTTCTLKEEQVEELAAGLKESGQPFIWVLKDADRGNIYADADAEDDDDDVGAGGEGRRQGRKQRLGCLDGIGEFGLVVRGWAPQLEILAHPATGCFMSHCGWNSCVESISMGVPILAWPMHSDQPMNTLLVARVLGAGLVLREWAEKDGVVPRAKVRDSIARLMASEEGRRVRERARELGVEVRQAAMDGGTSKKDLDDFVSYVSRQ